jgi:ClpP class serine protease
MLCTDQIANDVGSILSGKEAVACGLMDGIGTLADALAWLHEQGA